MIIFNKGCLVYSIWYRSLFVSEIEPPPKENLIITDSDIQEILGVGIIKIDCWTENGNHKLLFKKINQISSLLIIMISANTLENFGLVRDLATNTLRLSSQLICYFKKKFGLNIFKLTNLRIQSLEQQFTDLSTTTGLAIAKTISIIQHERLAHIGPDTLYYIDKREGIIINNRDPITS